MSDGRDENDGFAVFLAAVGQNNSTGPVLAAFLHPGLGLMPPKV